MATLLAKRTVSATRRAPAPAARAHALDVPFAMRAQAAAAGARWDEDHGVFVYRGAALPDPLRPFRAQPYSWERAVEREINGDPPPPPSPPAGGITLRPHQREAVGAIERAVKARRGGFLLADDVGLGKTISAWEGVRAMPAVKTALIVCPLAVIAHWRRTIEAMGDGGISVVVMNYERLGKLFGPWS